MANRPPLSAYPPDGFERRLIERFVSLRRKRVLEVGCGDGRLTQRYAHDAGSVVAIDPDAAAVAELAAAFPDVDARAIGFDELIVPPRSVDIVLFAWSL